MRVLIVDDRPENQLLLQAQLRGLNMVSVMADSGVRALHEVRAHPFDLVVTDLLMPEMDGFQLCYLLKTDPQLKKLPVVIYTANYATKKDEEQAKNLGADDFITRPIDEEILTDRIRRVLDRAGTGHIAEPKSKPEEGFFREYSSLLIEKLEDQLITAEENAKLHADLAKANKELLRLNEDLESYSYSVSHDLRAPVRAIEGMVALLVEEIGPSLTPAAKKSVERIEFNVGRMNSLINGLLEHYRMRNVGDAIARVDLQAAVATALKGLEFAGRLVNAKVQVTGPLPPVKAHEQALVQIVTNLVENAVKFVPPGTSPEVVIAAQRRGDVVRLTVTDNGIGIPAKNVGRVFNMFERLNPASEYPGTGVGLAIVRRGAERMGGQVGVDSVVGQGSTFWLELRAAPDPAA